MALSKVEPFYRRICMEIDRIYSDIYQILRNDTHPNARPTHIHHVFYKIRNAFHHQLKIEIMSYAPEDTRSREILFDIKRYEQSILSNYELYKSIREDTKYMGYFIKNSKNIMRYLSVYIQNQLQKEYFGILHDMLHIMNSGWYEYTSRERIKPSNKTNMITKEMLACTS